MRKYNNLVGQRFGYLEVLRRDGNTLKKYKRGRKKRSNIMWLCRCDCGEQVRVRGDQLQAGRQKSCARNGHYFLEYLKDRPPGLLRQFPREYQSYKNMHSRCYDPKHKNFKNYGGRGILVCERWHTFEFFVEDMGPKPTPQHTIERNDVNGNYEKSNCRWATRKEQYRNQRRSVYIEFNGQRILLMDVTQQLGLSRTVVYQRLKLGWPLSEALLVPKGQRNPNRPRPKTYKKHKRKSSLPSPSLP